jgi:dihydrofolate reductase
MKRIRYSVAMSLDGYIAGPNGESDWIASDPEMDFAALSAQFDTLLVGRRTFLTMVQARRTTMPGMKTVVLSTTLRAEDYPGVTIIGEQAEEQVAALRDRSTKDLWLFGGGELFRRLLEAGLVDTVEVVVEPVLLGAGVPLLPTTVRRTKLRLTSHRVYRSGIVRMEYDVMKGGITSRSRR